MGHICVLLLWVLFIAIVLVANEVRQRIADDPCKRYRVAIIESCVFNSVHDG